MEYLTVADKSVGELTEKRSRFVSALYPASDEQSAREIIEHHNAEYRDADHNVYAYRIYDGVTKYSDDGEPHSTAGRPTLNALERVHITNCVIITARYFGGVLLGTGGLSRAYAECARRAVANASIVKISEICRYCAYLPYSQYELFTAWICKYGGNVTEKEFRDIVSVHFSVPLEYDEKFAADVKTSQFRDILIEPKRRFVSQSGQ